MPQGDVGGGASVVGVASVCVSLLLLVVLVHLSLENSH